MVNVGLQTFKSISTVQGGKFGAAASNALTYGFYTIILKQISSYPLGISVLVMVTTNFIGVYAVKLLLEKTRKERLWKITVVTNQKNQLQMEEKLRYRNIEYVVFNLPESKKIVFDIYSNSEIESAYIKEILSNIGGRVSVVEIEKEL